MEMNAASNRRVALALCVGATLGAAAPLHAQDSAGARQDSAGARSGAPVADSVITREDLQARRTEIAMQALEITDAQRQKLEPIYTQYRDAAAKQNARYAKVLAAFVEGNGQVTDAQAQSLAVNFLQFQADRVSLQKKYLPKFQSVLPGVKALRLLQIENKIDAVVNFGLADAVPLAQTLK
jgi:Spy/CpxP family protein refolding chaperone